MENTEQNTAGEFILYARVWPRVKALLIDGFILAGLFVVAALIGANVAGTGAAAFLVWMGVWALYDPILVSRTGGTVGHHLQNLRVVSDRSGRPPSIVRAFVRNIFKTVLGSLSLLGMAGSSRHKAIHDLIAGTTVQAQDAGVARLRDFLKVRRPPAV